MSKLNTELFKAIRDKIATTPEAYDQSYDHRRSDDAPCGTACCIGGWADILSADDETERLHRLRHGVDLNRAADALGLGGTDYWSELNSERARLFTEFPADWWPQAFASRWKRTSTADGRARVAVAYLDHIIETGKVLE